jgi:hypothetical protein
MAGISPSRGIPLIRIKSGALAEVASTASLDLNIVAASQLGPVKDRIPPRSLEGPLRGTIEDIVYYHVIDSTTAPQVTLHFWANNSHNITALATVRLWASEQVAQNDFTREGAGATTSIYRGHVGGLDIPYADEDNTGQFHITVQNEQTTALTASKHGFEIGFRPEFPG